MENISNEKYFSKKSIYLSRILGKNTLIKLKKLNLKIRYNRMKRILKYADIILPNSQLEAELIFTNFKSEKDKIKVIYNGIGKAFESCRLIDSERKYALQVGRIELQKNTHLTIRACKELNIPLVLVGNVADNEYYKLCLEEGRDSDLTVLNNKNHEELIKIYRKAKIHILPSYRETPGLVSLEAGVLGCNIVSTNVGSSKEYFGDLVSYCSPKDYNSIKDAIKLEWDRDNNDLLNKYICNNFTWNIAARKTLQCYNECLNRRR